MGLFENGGCGDDYIYIYIYIRVGVLYRGGSSGGAGNKTKTLTSTPVTQSTTSWNLWVIRYYVTAGSTNSN